VLRDRYGVTQAVFEEGRTAPEVLAQLKGIGRGMRTADQRRGD
jgi:hypothetical protein